MATQTRVDVSPGLIAAAAVGAVIAMTATDIGLNLVSSLIENQELISFDTILRQVTTWFTHAVIVFGAIWMAVEGFDVKIAGIGVVGVYAASLLENIIRVARLEYVEFGFSTVFSPLYTVTYFLGFVVAIWLVYEFFDES